ncbi:uncharacterized protein natalisin [Drosophila virilis]|uniref:uncharacterized protein natalisin n=1 Tax=Drosophila virilis TaxID=7244 RepID=UPI001395EADB|nr:uncharacterized protein LOC6630736 [Drosophila virilis]
MRLTLAWLCVCLAIYCSGGFANNGRGNVVLSLPPSLIAATEVVALRQLQQQQQQQREQQQQTLHEHPRWKKDARVLFDSGSDSLRDIAHSKESASEAGKYMLAYNNDDDGVRVEVEQQPADLNRKALSESYDLEARQQSAPQEIAPQHGHGLELKSATPTPHKYWASRCQPGNGNCPREYHRAMLTVRNRDAVARLRHQLNEMQDQLDSGNVDAAGDTLDDSNEDLSLKSNNNEVFMLLTGEQDLVKFLHWAMQLLYPHQHPIDDLNGSAADFYHPGMFIWKKFNFSGHLEPPLIVDEPHYVLVRREKQNLKHGYQLGDDLNLKDDPFIPPRGRKHTTPDLEELLNRYETFVPNRGKRDKVKDLFKYDDLFYPNRGKKHRDIFKLDDPFFPHRGKKLQLRDLYNVDDPFFPNRGKRQVTAKPSLLPASMWGKLHSGSDNSNNNDNDIDKGDNWPQRMSTHEINGNDQSVKTSMSAGDATEGASWQRLATTQVQLQTPQPANRLHSTRSMSANLQQQPDQLQRLSFIVSPGMRQQQRQQQQVKTSWPARSYQRWQRSAHDARETQLTRGLNASPTGHDTDFDIDYGQLDM